MDNTLKAEIGCLVQKGKMLLQCQPLEFEPCYETIKEIVSLLPCSGLSPTASSFEMHLSKSQQIFIDNYYSGFANCMLDHLNPEWLQPDENGRRLMPLFDCYFLNGSPEDAFIILSRAFTVLRPGVCLLHCIGLMEKLVKSGCLKILFRKHCCENPVTKFVSDSSDVRLSKSDHLQMQQWQSLLNTIASLPDFILAHSSMKEASEFFYRDSYIAFCSREILSTLYIVHQYVLKDQKCSVLLIAMVIGKLSLAGYGDVLWTNLLPDLESACLHDFVWRRIIQRVIADLPERSIEMVVTQLLVQLSSRTSLTAFFGSMPSVNKKMAYVFTHKLLLVRYFDGPHADKILKKLIGYMSDNNELSTQLMLPAFQSLLAAWSDNSSLRHRSVQQSLYLCKAVVTCVILASPDFIKTVHTDIVRTLLDGLSNYLGSSIRDIRHMGCFVAEKLSTVVHKDIEGQQLHFELEVSDVTRSLSELTVALEKSTEEFKDIHKGKCVDTSKTVVNVDSDNEKGGTRSSVVGEPIDNNITAKQAGVNDNIDSDDSADELTPYPAFSGGKQQPNSKRPMYLAQCLAGLVQSDDPERTEQCLQCVEALVRKCNATTASEISVELSRVLLHLDDRYALPDFTVLRYRALVAVTVVCPNQVAQYLAGEFYARNYSIRQRMDILDVLASAVSELSEPPKSNQSCSSIANPGLETSISEASLEHWSEVVRKRVESNTRRFGKNRKNPSRATSTNRLVDCAGSFFYPLMTYFDRQNDACLDLLGVDYLLYERLIYTLGVVVMASRNLPMTRNMSLSALEFVRCARHHSQAGVRRAVLHTVCAVLVALPRGTISDDPSSVVDLGEWLRAVLEHDTDPECQNRSAQCLQLLKAHLSDDLR